MITERDFSSCNPERDTYQDTQNDHLHMLNSQELLLPSFPNKQSVYTQRETWFPIETDPDLLISGTIFVKDFGSSLNPSKPPSLRKSCHVPWSFARNESVLKWKQDSDKVEKMSLQENPQAVLFFAHWEGQTNFESPKNKETEKISVPIKNAALQKDLPVHEVIRAILEQFNQYFKEQSYKIRFETSPELFKIFINYHSSAHSQQQSRPALLDLSWNSLFVPEFLFGFRVSLKVSLSFLLFSKTEGFLAGDETFSFETLAKSQFSVNLVPTSQKATITNYSSSCSESDMTINGTYNKQNYQIQSSEGEPIRPIRLDQAEGLKSRAIRALKWTGNFCLKCPCFGKKQRSNQDIQNLITKEQFEQKNL